MSALPESALFSRIAALLNTARRSVRQAVNSTMVQTYFGKGFDETNLRKMRQFYLLFPMRDALSSELSWTHYRHLLRVENEPARALDGEQLFAAKYQGVLPKVEELEAE